MTLYVSKMLVAVARTIRTSREIASFDNPKPTSVGGWISLFPVLFTIWPWIN